MTIIIAAHLDDDRRIIVADGLSTMNGVVTSTRMQKAGRVSSSASRKGAVFGVAGEQAMVEVIDEILARMCAAPAARGMDMFSRLAERLNALQWKWDAEALFWFENKLYQIDCAHQVSEITDWNYYCAGTGWRHAHGALLGLAMKAAQPLRDEVAPQSLSNVILTAHHSTWRPSYDDVMLAYDVAVAMNTGCGGERTVVTL